MTETDRRRLHRALHEKTGEEADILMNALPTDPDRLATRDDLQLLGADLRTEMVALGSTLRAEFHDATTGQTRTLLLGLIGTVVTMSTVQLASLLALS